MPLIINLKLLVIGTACLFLVVARPVLAAGATLSLSPASKSVANGETFNVGVMVDTGGQTVSRISTVIQYDPTIVSPVIVPGTSFVLAKNTVVGGVITLETELLTPNFTGTGTLATINLKALKNGVAQMTIVFTGATVGSSVVVGANGTTNILSLVNSGVYTIGEGSGTTTITPTPPQTGDVETTLIVLGIGIALLVTSGTGLLWKVKP